ncbi:hypothetical protein GUITHDRAFT_113779 [Guillardia theta CCMP2712]|uniref:Uncharacterized protein n=1 Tax=Guillardia theta (strain CCMP2712) TaxID=905079 RepID=L1IVA2_GUITC|nr:hypothetical protein GUITHDRAFT_113779 [Guillardia theta CCMP2712]EKX40042.1 hypothetical protein GUITHDRAFT_113779 [Guillardia theta CCMP2712]|eukprot:XP_005827022.1 hypothetical protein GUITHDRAFT_113779 [Guillardia theta CCMP2712]
MLRGPLPFLTLFETEDVPIEYHRSQPDRPTLQYVYVQKGPPLVTARSFETARNMHAGVPLDGIEWLRPAEHFVKVPPRRMLAVQKPSAFEGVPPWMFLLTFVGAVVGIILLFQLAERIWDKRQEPT